MREISFVWTVFHNVDAFVLGLFHIRERTCSFWPSEPG
jgi:hypothetical protein